MLKLHRDKHSREVKVSLRRGKRFLTESLGIALLFALGFHLLALVVFHIHPFRLWEGMILPPVEVEIAMADDVDQERATLAQMDSERLKRRVQLDPPITRPSLPEIDITISPPVLVIEPELPPLKAPFERLEQELKRILAVPPKETTYAVTLQPVGTLYHRKWKLTDRGKALLDDWKKEAHEPIVIDVRLDEQTGKVFWFESGVTSTKGLPIASLLEEFQMEPLHARLVTAGSIEIFWERV